MHLCCAAVVSTQEDMIDYLVCRYPYFKLHATEKFVTDTDCEKLIGVLDLVSAACILHGNANTRKYGLSCFRVAMKFKFLEGRIALPKRSILSSSFD